MSQARSTLGSPDRNMTGILYVLIGVLAFTIQDVIIKVPPGTIIRDTDRGHILKDLEKDGDSLVVAKGGKGGRGNTYFKTSTNRTPREAERGQDGEERNITLELKL